jgi:transglutaminase-like putative cysteine protease
MKKYLFFLIMFSFSVLYCQKHLITDSNCRTKVEKKFELRKELAKNRADKLFGVFNAALSSEENEALKFLYAYMPLCDLADYNGEFFLKQVKYALKARDTFNWGKTIPEVIFRHFVLPYRVNNENLDTARVVFYEELKDRVKGLSLKDAALEVNHWCLEKVTYKGSDGRTSAPLSSMRTAWGRCGEESTFTVTALRSVGIPARQVYTPRWAHSDDNHAWVEVWVDGKWYYMGACEPEPDLNMGWFTEPARRAMLVHTKVFGDYPDKAEVVNKDLNYTEINVISNYADTKKIFVKVVDNNSKPVENAKVDFGLYNYAEFYPIASKQTDKKGITYLTTGFGTLVIWGSNKGSYAYEKIAVAATDTLILRLAKHSNKISYLEYDLIPPAEKQPYPSNAAEREKNNQRVKEENAIREKYRSIFIDSISIANFADIKKLDKELVRKYLKLSEGNWRDIKSFLETNALENKDYLFGILAQISEKDLRDASAAVLQDHFKNALSLQKENNTTEEIFINYILNPRIKSENLVSYRSVLRDGFKDFLKFNKKDIALKVTGWIKKNIKMNHRDNYYNLPLTPIGVYELRTANVESRDIFFVAVCRSLGVPAQLEPKLKTPQYYYNGQWLNVYFEKQTQIQPEYGYLTLKGNGAGSKVDPKYYTHFTIAKLENGVYKTIDYETEPVLSSFKEPIKLETGHYRLITGNRKPDGSVMSNIYFFNIEKEKTIEKAIVLREADVAEKTYGKIDLGQRIEFSNNPVELSKYFSKENIILGWVEPGKEPTRHAIVELNDLSKKFEEWGGSILLIVSRISEAGQYAKDNVSGLPKNVSFVREKEGKLLNSIQSLLNIKGNVSFPLFLVINKKGEIIFYSQGYKIGTGEQLLRNVLK